jgi:LysM repeat protein
MTEGDHSPRVAQSASGPEGAHAPDGASDAVFRTCPYLAAGGGAWRSSTPQRDHRCGAVRPAVVLQPPKQRQLCLTPEHRACATYLAATSLEQGPDGAVASASLLWPVARTRPLVLEPAGRLVLLSGLRGSRTAGQALLVGLMVIAFAVVVIARATPGGPGGSRGGGVLSTSSAGAATPIATMVSEPPSASATPTPPPTSSPSPTPAPPSATPRPTPAPSPSGTREYKVKAGDTLSGIAARFGTTVKVLKALNNIADPRLIRVGQILIIP